MSPRPPLARAVRPLLVAGLLAGCASSSPPPTPDPGVAARAATPPAAADEEARLWLRSAEEQARLDASGFRADLPEVEAYLEEIVARLRPAPLPHQTPFRVRVLVDPSLNAFAYPNGVIYLHTGLLARAENEAQIAAVLAHESAHATHRHGLLHQRQIRGATGFAATVTVGTLGLGALLGGVGALAAVSGYSKEHEREADRTGFALYVGAGYDPRAAVTMFELLSAEAKRAGVKEPFFFGSHPRLAERIANHRALIAKLPPERRSAGRLDAEAFAPVLRQTLPLNAEAALRAGDVEGALLDVARGLALDPGSPALRLVEADALRRRAKGDDRARALGRYRELVALAPDLAPAWRGLGLVEQAAGELSSAAAAYRRYLELSPGAPDHDLVLSLLRQCESSAP
jgi:predicted Zn-dependent protease